MQRLSTTSSVLILMFFSDLHTRAFRFLLPQLSQSVKNTVRISVIAQTEKKLRITATRVFFSAVLSMTVTGLLSSKMLQQQALQLKKLSRLSRLRAM
jgi:DNA-directed RNA polymerase beta subunit